jgi:hypothetical protein
MVWTCSAHGEIRNAYVILVEIIQSQAYLWRIAIRLDDIEMDLIEIGCEHPDWFCLARERYK